MRGIDCALGFALLGFTACATPYQEIGLLGGVQSSRISSDTVQITARGNAYTDPDTIQRFVMRKAAEETVAAGFDTFEILGSRDRTQTGRIANGFATASGSSAWAYGSSWDAFKPGETVMIKMRKGPVPEGAPGNVFDAREVLKFMVGTYVPAPPK